MADARRVCRIPRPRLFDLTGQVALVTGSSRGLGWAMAQAIAGAGAHVVLNGRDAARRWNRGARPCWREARAPKSCAST